MSDPNPTPAQQEFKDLIASSARDDYHGHPEDRPFNNHSDEEIDEEDAYRAAQIDAAMRMPTLDNRAGGATGAPIKLPPASFDSGRATGVKGVIADARSYEAARRSNWRSKARTVRRSIFGLEGGTSGGHIRSGSGSRSRSDSEADEEAHLSPEGGLDDDDDESEFLEQWRENRRKELESEAARGTPVRNRRTSPSIRAYGRLDEVDALGYLDAVEKVRRETIVVVFVTDLECVVSATVEAALRPLVTEFPAIHFVKVSCEDIEFDNAAVPAFLAYKNQGDLFANLTGVVEMIPEDEDFGTQSLRGIFEEHQIL